jgi:hypothetical protein
MRIEGVRAVSTPKLGPSLVVTLVMRWSKTLRTSTNASSLVPKSSWKLKATCAFRLYWSGRRSWRSSTPLGAIWRRRS